MMATRDEIWFMIHEERAALARDLESLDEAQWVSPSLCSAWSVREVVAHLSATASVGRFQWILSVLSAGFNFDLHNQRRLEEHMGETTADTLAEFRRLIPSTTAPVGHPTAWLGEVIVHSADIRRPLGIPSDPHPRAIVEVARFFACRDFTVPSQSAINDLRLEATDDSFSVGAGLMVRGTPLALVMAMAGRSAFCDDLTGDGVALLRSRCPAP